MPKKTFQFRTKLSPASRVFLNTVVFLPDDIVRALPKGRIRAKGTMNGAPFDLAPQYKKDGSRFFTVSAALRKAAGIKAGDAVEVKFQLTDPESLVLPEELQAVLDQDPDGRAVWDTFTTGLQRSLMHYVTSAKTVDTRIKRSLELIEKAKTRSLSFQKKEGA